MTKSLMAVLAASTAAIASVPAHAVVIFSGVTTDTAYAADFMPGAGAFNNTFTFTVGVPGVVNATIQNISTSKRTNIDFNDMTSMFLGAPFPEHVTLGGFERLTAPLNGGSISVIPGITYMFNVAGTAGVLAKYTVNVSYSPTAVPEPATWALMIVGVGLVGAVTRNRAERKLTVRYA